MSNIFKIKYRLNNLHLHLHTSMCIIILLRAELLGFFVLFLRKLLFIFLCIFIREEGGQRYTVYGTKDISTIFKGQWRLLKW